jgi:ribonuclease R
VNHTKASGSPTLNERVLRLLGSPRYQPLDTLGLRQALKLHAHQAPGLQTLIDTLVEQGAIAKVKGGRYALPADADLVPGRIRVNRRGVGTLTPNDPALPEFRVPADAMGTALHGDRVLVRREVGGGKENPTGTVIEILVRARTRIVGTLQRSHQFWFVVPNDPRLPHDIYIADHGDAKEGDPVVAEILEWRSPKQNPEGRIAERLGAPGEHSTDMLSVIRHYDLPTHFPEEVESAAKRFGTTPAPEDMRGRKDCRKHRVMTIDPVDARDFDDALCLQPAEGGRWRVWVHIADVSHYVRTGDPLDREARRRGNSTYLVDRVIPMLPEALSNELCSLKPGVDRLTKCVEFLISPDGTVERSTLYPAVIHSQRRFTYAEVLARLRAAPTDEFGTDLHHLHRLAQNLRARRMKEGALDLDFPEIKLRVDDQGQITAIERNENDESHQLIEEFMLLANQVVAARLRSQHTTSLFRIHEPPDPEKLAAYRAEIRAAGIPCGNLEQPKEVQRLIARLKAHPAGTALRIGLLRSLKRARYAPQPLGHYGLAKADYTHFTSPIRRYADLVIHRTLFDPPAARPKKDDLAQIADHLSTTERNSADAEQDSRNIKLHRYLQEQIDSRQIETYEALVTEVRNFGVFVDVLPLGISGLVPVSLLRDDLYLFDAARQRLLGRRSRREIALGQRVKVTVARVDFFKRQVDFILAQDDRSLPNKKTNPPAAEHSPQTKNTNPTPNRRKQKSDQKNRSRRRHR